MTREEAIEVLQKNYPDSCYSMLREAVDMAIEALSADRPTGKWLKSDGTPYKGKPNNSCWCSECGEWLVASDEYDVDNNFCPNCGAKMVKNNG